MARDSRRRNRRNAITEQFNTRPTAMLRSASFRVLSRASHMVLARIEIEHSQHGGNHNGQLPITYEHFVEYGLHRHAIAPAIRELSALGIIEVTLRGVAGNAEYRRPSQYRLTYRHAHGELGDGTHEWRKIETIEQAEAIAKRARAEVDSRVVTRAKKTKSQCRFPPRFSAGFRHRKSKFPVMVFDTTSPVMVSDTTSISRAGAGERRPAKRAPHSAVASGPSLSAATAPEAEVTQLATLTKAIVDRVPLAKGR